MRKYYERDYDVAPEGMVFVCGACGKRSKDIYGNQAISRGWDESCALNCNLYAEKDLLLDKEGLRVIAIDLTEQDRTPR